MNEAPEHCAHLPALADPRAHRRLPARGCVGAADAGRPGRLPSAGAAGGLARPVAKLLPRRPHALRDPVEGRGAARLGRPRRRARLQGADAPRPIAGGSARRPIRPGLRRAPLHVALPARGRVGGGDRQPDHARGHAPRLGPRPDGRLPRPDGRLGEAKRTARDCLHGRDQPVPAPDRVPADDATDRAELAGARGGEPTPAHAKLVARNGQMPTMNWDTAIDLLRRTPSTPGRVRQVAVPPAARTLSTLSYVDYEDAFLVETGPAQHRT